MPVRRYARLVLLLWLIALGVICVRVGVSPRRQSVYAADYAPAGRNWLHGQEIYSIRQRFIYSPLAAAAIAPFAALPAGVGGILWRVGCAAAFAATVAAWLRGGLSGLGDLAAPPRDSPEIATVFLLLLPLTAGNVNLGQMNLLVLVMSAGGILAVHRRGWNLAAFLFAAAGFMKIYPLAVGLLLAMLYPRQLTWRLAAALVLLFVVSLGLQRPGYVWTEYHHWFGVLGRDDRLDGDLYSSWRDFGFLLRASGVPLSDRAYRVMEAGAGGALALFLWVGQRYRAWTDARLLGGVFALGCAWMVLFGPATESATYVLLSLPLCAAMVMARRLPRARGRWAVFAVSYAVMLFSELTSAWFHGITHHLYMRALQPVAALLFAAGIVAWLLRPPSLAPPRP